MHHHFTLQQNTVTIEQHLLFTFPTLHIQPQDKIGIVGLNGVGKSLFLQLIKSLFPQAYLHQQLHIEQDHLSGGELAMHHLYEAIDTQTPLLLLDEPTNNLDSAHMQFLQKQLDQFNGAYLIVSHDRHLLDCLTTKIWHIHHNVLTEYHGNYSAFEKQQKLELTEQARAYKTYIHEKKHLEQALLYKQCKSQKMTTLPKHFVSGELKHAKKTKVYYANLQKQQAKIAKAIEKRLERLPKVEPIQIDKPIILSNVLTQQRFPKYVIKCDCASFAYGKHLLWQDVTLHLKFSDKIGLTGNNGVGKTTFLKQLLKGTQESISIHPALTFGYFQQNITSALQADYTLLTEVLSTSVQSEQTIYAMLQDIGFLPDEWHKPIHTLSGGERVKCALVKLLSSNINALLLDEPTNHLDIKAIHALAKFLKHFKGFIIAISHDQTFLKSFTNKHLHIEKGSIHDLSTHPITPKTTHNAQLLDFRLTQALSRLSLEPDNPVYLQEYQTLLALKKETF